MRVVTGMINHAVFLPASVRAVVVVENGIELRVRWDKGAGGVVGFDAVAQGRKVVVMSACAEGMGVNGVLSGSFLFERRIREVLFMVILVTIIASAETSVSVCGVCFT